MPVGTVPFENAIAKITNDPETEKTIKQLRVGNFAITPEVRFYVSKKGFGRGFYIAPFYRHTNFTLNNIRVDYDNDAGSQNTINLSGKFSSNTGGLLFGVQKAIGKHICLDLWLLGGHYGSGTGNFTGVPTQPLSTDEQKNLKEQLEGLDIPLTKVTSSVTANSASLKLDGPWAGIRTGVSMGVRF